MSLPLCTTINVNHPITNAALEWGTANLDLLNQYLPMYNYLYTDDTGDFCMGFPDGNISWQDINSYCTPWNFSDYFSGAMGFNKKLFIITGEATW